MKKNLADMPGQKTAPSSREEEHLFKEEELLFTKKKKPLIEKAPLKIVFKMLAPFAGLAISAIEFVSLPQVYPLSVQYKSGIWLYALAVCAVIYALLYVLALFVRPVREKVSRFAWLIFAFFLFFTLQDYLTLRTGILKLPFVPSPDKIINELVSNIDTILSDMVSSAGMLFGGLILGSVLGFISGIACGCLRLVDYWINPLLKIIGPVPALIWMPLFFVTFHSSNAAALAAVSLASWFPLTLMISSAIKSMDNSLIERAETLGASKFYIVLHVMLPNSIPSVANALFMALSGSFGAMAAAELCGVSSGLMFRIQYTRVMANYGEVYAIIGVMIVMFATLTAIMFAFRNWLLRWQKGLARW